MRKLIVAIVAVLYLGVSSGAVVTIHQCMGKLSSVSFSEKEKPCKCSVKAKKKMPCCKSESKLLKMKADHQQSIENFSFAQNAVAVLPVFPSFVYTLQATKVGIAYSVHAPPLIVSKLYIANSVFRI